MENASKALLIAGGVLLAILIIALGIYIFNVSRGSSKYDQLETIELQAFNAPFLQYEGRHILGSDVKKLLEHCMSNALDNDGADEKLPDVIYIDTRNQKYILESVLGPGASSNVAADHVFYTASGKNTRVEWIAKSLGMHQGIHTSYFGIPVKSGNVSDAVSKIAKLKAIIADKQYYQVAYHRDDKMGVVDFVCIRYINN